MCWQFQVENDNSYNMGMLALPVSHILTFSIKFGNSKWHIHIYIVDSCVSFDLLVFEINLTGLQRQDAANSSTSAAEHQILVCPNIHPRCYSLMNLNL